MPWLTTSYPKRRLDTIRVRVIEQRVIGGRVGGKHMEHGPKDPESVRIVRSVRKCMKMYEGVGIKLLRSGSNISAQIMSAKME